MNERKENTVGRGTKLGAAVAAALACLALSAGATAKGFDKPQRPAKDWPDVAALAASVAPTPDSTQRSLGASRDWLRAAWGNGQARGQQRAGGGGGYAQPLGSAAPGAIGATTLVLYDTTGPYGWLGELYAVYAGNLASHFGTWKALPVSKYTAGLIGRYTATIYIGSTYDEPLPTAFLDDVANATRPVIWIYDNIWSLSNRLGASAFQAKYGWMWWQFDTSAISHVDYEGTILDRDSDDNLAGVMEYAPGSIDTTKTTPLAWAVRDGDQSRFPWALRSGNLLYFGENPFVYTSETDRVYAFDAILEHVLNPFTQERHRALLRLEDLSPHDDPQNVFKIANYLWQQGIPYGFGFSPVYTDPLAKENPRPTTLTLSGREGRTMSAVVKWMQSHGGTLVMHGYTHQYRNIPNPYTGVTDDDFEFYRTIENADHTLTFAGPVPEDSTAWMNGRLDASFREFDKAGVDAPTIFEFPHYMGSALDYQVVAQRFKTRWERSLYFGGALSGGAADYSHVIGQFYPWVVRDAYGTTVLPENAGDYEPEPFFQFPIHTVDDVLAAAKASSVIDDGMVGMYFHNFWGLEPLKQMVEGIRAEGWTFVDPARVAVAG